VFDQESATIGCFVMLLAICTETGTSRTISVSGKSVLCVIELQPICPIIGWICDGQ
jgi:hypothetical protein